MIGAWVKEIGITLWDFFKGKKTFIIAALMVALGILQNDPKTILEGLGFIGLRLAIPPAQ